MVKNLLISLILLFPVLSYSFTLEEYSHEYTSGKNIANESLKRIDKNTWKMTSSLKHSIFQSTQEAIFEVYGEKVILLNASRKIRAFGGLRKEKQSFVIDYDENKIFYEYDKDKGLIPTDCVNFKECSFYENLSLQIQSKFYLNKEKTPFEIEYNYLDKGKVKKKFFLLEKQIDSDLTPSKEKKIRFSEIRDDNRGFALWFDPENNFKTYKIYQDFGSQDLTWNVRSMPSEE